MNPTIFADHVAPYHAKGLPVIPLYPREKKPIVPDWSRFHDTKVDAETSAEWINRFPTANMGMVLGEASGLIMIDIDTDEAAVYDAIISVLPYSPWQRKGRKGMVMAYKFSPIKTHRIKNLSGQTLVECLSSRTQCVLPPSIHPDTQLPYEQNVELLSVIDQLNFLPDNIEELLRGAVKGAGVELSHSGWSRVTEYVSAGSRDTTLTEMAGLFAYAVVRGERSLKEAVGMLQAYHAEFIENVAGGDTVGADKHVENLIKFLHRDVLDKGKVLPQGWDEGYTQEQLEQLGVQLGADETEWDLDTIIAHLQERFQTHAEGKGRSEAVEGVLLKMSRSNSLTKIDEDRILKYIIDVAGLGVQMSTLRARLRELRTGDVKGNDHSEIARAVLKDLEQYNLVRFQNEKFMKWAGSHWVEMHKNPIKADISNRYGHLDACKRSSDISGILTVLSVIMPQGICRTPMKGVNFANGFLTQELKLIPHDPDYGMTYTLPFRYMEDEASKFPMFADFLFQSWGRDEDYQQKMNALQEAMCVTLFGLGSKYQRAIILHGAPHSGKTQLLRIIETLVPNEAKCAVPPEDWGDKFLATMLYGNILNVCGELSDKKLIDGQKFKDIVDGGEMSGQYKNQQIFRFRPNVTHWFASNHMPKTTDTSSGFIRRWLFLTFHYPVTVEKKVADLGDLIASEEREAIVAWATQAMPRLLKQHDFTLPHSHKMLVNEFANVNNSVRYFIKESQKVRCNVEGGFCDENKLYNAYFAFCLGAGGMKPVQPIRFRAMLRELQGELGFELRIAEGKGGASQAMLERLTLVV